eukprot:13976342-Alexandrium_andersonii.AAC.1
MKASQEGGAMPQGSPRRFYACFEREGPHSTKIETVRTTKDNASSEPRDGDEHEGVASNARDAPC